MKHEKEMRKLKLAQGMTNFATTMQLAPTETKIFASCKIKINGGINDTENEHKIRTLIRVQIESPFSSEANPRRNFRSHKRCGPQKYHLKPKG